MENKTAWDIQIEKVNEIIKEQMDKGFPVWLLSDGYHTFNQLYEFRKIYNAALFNEWAMLWNENKLAIIPKYNVCKSYKHSDGEFCFGGGWFIVNAQLPSGQISNHYEIKDWDLFKIPEVETAPEWDGHTSEQVLERLKQL